MAETRCMRTRLASILAAALLAGGCATSSSRNTTANPARGACSNVVLISIDGYRAGYFDSNPSPILRSLAATGVRAQWMTPSFPTITEPNHYTLLTGLYPDHHGIVNNDMADPYIQRNRFLMGKPSTTGNPRWWSEAIPIWVSLRRDGIPAAEMSWPGNYGQIDGMRPDFSLNGRPVGDTSTETATVIKWLALPASERPQLTLIHYESVDHMGHVYGPGSLQVNEAIQQVDHAIGEIVAALKHNGTYDKTDLIIVSDHGMTAIAPDHRIYLDNLVDTGTISMVSLGPLASISPHPAAGGGRSAEMLLAPHAHMQCWLKDKIPSHLHYGTNSRIPPIECLADPGWLITTHYQAAHATYTMHGDHGYDPRDPDMRALFLAEGPSFRKGVVVPPFPNVDVYPLLTQIFHIAQEPNDGSIQPLKQALSMPTTRAITGTARWKCARERLSKTRINVSASPVAMLHTRRA